MRLYDIVVLVTPDLNDDDAAKVAGEYKKILVDGGANVVKDEPWGKRRLAFPILRKREAHSCTAVERTRRSSPGERRMASRQVLRHLAVRVDEELKRAGRCRALRVRRRRRRAPALPLRRRRTAAPVKGAILEGV